jgi:hypothetical protein
MVAGVKDRLWSANDLLETAIPLEGGTTVTNKNEQDLIATLREIRNTLILTALLSERDTAQAAKKILIGFAEQYFGKLTSN